MKKAAAATAAQVAMYGHIAARLRATMKQHKLKTVADFNEKLGLDRAAPHVYHWLAAKGAPSPQNRKNISAALGIPESDLIPRKPGMPSQHPIDAQTSAAIGEILKAPPRATDVLTFTLTDQGQARIKLDLVLPFDQGVPLLRILLDAGMIVGKETAHD